LILQRRRAHGSFEIRATAQSLVERRLGKCEQRHQSMQRDARLVREEHASRKLFRCTPVRASKQLLRDSLARPIAIETNATGEAAGAPLVVNRTTIARRQMSTCRVGWFVETETLK
jgi:hypothetical protein